MLRIRSGLVTLLFCALIGEDVARGALVGVTGSILLEVSPSVLKEFMVLIEELKKEELKFGRPH